MNSQQLLFINFLILLAIVLFFLSGRSKPKQYLNLKKKDDSKSPVIPSLKPEEPVSVVAPSEVLETIVQPVVEAPKTEVLHFNLNPVVPEPVRPKGGSVLFIYNGHEWDAHEVLGVVRGCDLQEATTRYQHLIKTSDPSTFEFFDAAYSSILKSLRA